MLKAIAPGYIWRMAGLLPPPPPLFVECQPMLRHWWGLALLAPAIILAAALGLDTPPNWPATGGLIVLATIFSGWLLSLMKLHTQLTAEGVRVRFTPLQSDWQFVAWPQVRRAYLRTYAPLRDYGGWGIRTFTGENEAYNAWGNQGLQLILATGERLLIGTQHPEAIRQVLRRLRISGTQPEVPD